MSEICGSHTQLAANRAQKKDTAHTIELITCAENLRVHLLVKINKGERMVFLSKLFNARMAGHDQHPIVTQKAKPLTNSQRDNADCLSCLARLAELMIIGGVKEGRYTAARLNEAQANEVAITRELPVISEERTP